MKTDKTQFDVIVIGGGASGMMAAGRAAENNRSVLLLEKNNKLGEKLKITGGGRCNITNAEPDIHKFIDNYGDATKYLHSAFARFGVNETITFFESRGLSLVTEARNRMFPKSMRAFDVYRTLNEFIKKNNVVVRTGEAVHKIKKSGQEIQYCETFKNKYYAKSYIIATGGNSRPETGSTGDGFPWLKSLGHTVSRPSPDIVPLRANDNWVHKLSGVSLSFMKIYFLADGKRVFSKTGKILFTHFGLSGPLILNSSKKVGDLLEAGKVVTAKIDVFPDTGNREFDQKILKVFQANPNKMLRNVIDEFTPRGLGKAMFLLLPNIDFNKKTNTVTKEERVAIRELLKSLPITSLSLMGMDRAVISDGGVNIEEVNFKTMQSKIVKNLYLTGDILNISRPSGGYSLQLCWTTGFLAGSNA